MLNKKKGEDGVMGGYIGYSIGSLLYWKERMELWSRQILMANMKRKSFIDKADLSLL